MKEKIRETLLSMGADVCGFAGEERLVGMSEGFSPLDVWSGCKIVISFGVALPKGLEIVNPRLVYAHFNGLSTGITDKIAFNAAKYLEREFGCIAVPVPCDAPNEYWDKESLTAKGLFSMKEIAVRAGIGSIGKNTLLTNEKYGNLLTLGALMTDLKLPSDELCESLCIAGCRKCIDSCPVGAICDGHVNQKLCRPNAYGKTARGFDTVDCNNCRTVCPMRFGKK